jgi:DNA-3-methyladenine glycosylase
MSDAGFDQAFFARSVDAVAADLLGCEFVVGECAGRIVEVEWYPYDDPASHSFRGPTPRCLTMFGPPGRLYVYRSYGIHWCANVVCEPEGTAGAVLIRALQPLRGLDLMRERRGLEQERLLCAGPGRLCEALGVTGADDGAELGGPRIQLRAGPPPERVLVGPRIGLSVSRDLPWRRGEAGSRYLSRPFPKEAPA